MHKSIQFWAVGFIIVLMLARLLLVVPLVSKISHAEVLNPVRQATRTQESWDNEDTVVLLRSQTREMEFELDPMTARLQLANGVIDAMIAAIILSFVLFPNGREREGGAERQ